MSRATLYRWADTTEHVTGQRVVRSIKAAAKEQAKSRTKGRVRKRRQRRKPGETAIEAATRQNGASTYRRSATIKDVLGADKTVPVIQHLRECIDASRAVMKHASNDDGTPKMSKLLLNAAESLRRNIETAQRIVEKVHEIQRVEEFHRIIIEEVRKVDEAAAMRILERIDIVSRQWGAV